jgi:SAM-dependent methyltransferase
LVEVGRQRLIELSLRLMHTLPVPKWDSLEVKKAADYLLSLSRADNPLCSFYRDYFLDNLVRIAINLVLLRGLVKPGDHYLDVGSFGIEPAIIRKEIPSCTVKALSYEGNRIGIGPNGFYESEDRDDSKCVHIEQIDVERQRFPYDDDMFHLVTCFDVLEHLKFSPIPMMKEIKRVLRADGFLVLTTPNINSARSIIKILCGWSPQECPLFHDSLAYGVIHPKEYTLEEIRDVFTSLGFDLEALHTVNMRKTDAIERVITSLMALVIPILRHFLHHGTFRSGLGEKLIVKAKKGGPIISEIPKSIFRPRGR